MLPTKSESPPRFLFPQDAPKSKRSLVLFGALLGCASLGFLLIGDKRHLVAPLAPPNTSLAVRPQYELSTYLEERNKVLDWFMLAAATVTGGFAFAATVTTCFTPAVFLVLPCVGSIVALAAASFTFAGSIYSLVEDYKGHESVGNKAQLNGGYLRLDPSARQTYTTRTTTARAYSPTTTVTGRPPTQSRLADHKRAEPEAPEWRKAAYGADYRFVGHITSEDTFNGHLVDRNGGNDVPVWAFTTPEGLRLNHVMIGNETAGSILHRFGFEPSLLSERQAVIANTTGYFTQGGMDAYDCTNRTAMSGPSLSAANQTQIQIMDQLNCTLPNWANADEISLQFFDAGNYSTMGVGRIAPVSANGTSTLTDPAFDSSCPSFDGGPSSQCGVESASSS